MIDRAEKLRMVVSRASGTLSGGILRFQFETKSQLRSSKAENCACPNLDAMSVPEALVHSIRILEAPAVYLKHRWLKS